MLVLTDYTAQIDAVVTITDLTGDVGIIKHLLAWEGGAVAALPLGDVKALGPAIKHLRENGKDYFLLAETVKCEVIGVDEVNHFYLIRRLDRP